MHWIRFHHCIKNQREGENKNPILRMMSKNRNGEEAIGTARKINPPHAGITQAQTYYVHFPIYFEYSSKEFLFAEPSRDFLFYLQ